MSTRAWGCGLAMATLLALAAGAGGASAAEDYSTRAPGDGYAYPNGGGDYGDTPVSSDQTLRVGAGQSYKTISHALKSARSGATIIVDPGIYRESLDIRRPVTIRAQPIAASGAASFGVTIDPVSDYCLRVSEKLTGAVAVEDIAFRVTPLYGFDACVQVDGGVFTLRNGVIDARDTIPGLLVRGGLVHMTDTRVSGARYGALITAEGTSGPEVYLVGNSFTSNETGLHVSGLARVTALSNQVTNNTVEGIVLDRAGGTFTTNQIIGNLGNAVTMTRPMAATFESNVVMGNRGSAFEVRGAGTGRISRNQITDNLGYVYTCGGSPCPEFTDDNLHMNNFDDGDVDCGLFDSECRERRRELEERRRLLLGEAK